MRIPYNKKKTFFKNFKNYATSAVSKVF